MINIKQNTRQQSGRNTQWEGAKTHDLTGAGALEIEMPRIRDRRENEIFISKIRPPYVRKSPNVAEVIPVLYLRGLSTGDFSEGLAALFGKGAASLSATTISRLTNVWKGEYAAFKNQRFEGKQFAYIWDDGIHFSGPFG